MLRSPGRVWISGIRRTRWPWPFFSSSARTASPLTVTAISSALSGRITGRNCSERLLSEYTIVSQRSPSARSTVVMSARVTTAALPLVACNWV